MKIKRRTLASIIWWSIRIAIVVIFSTIYYLYFHTQLFTITTYTISGVDEVTRATLQTQIEDLSKKKIYKIIPNDKIFTFSNSSIISTVFSNVPEMSSIDIRPVGLHAVKIDIDTFTPLFKVSDSQGLTEDGIIFSTKNDLRNFPRLEIASSTTTTFKRNGLTYTKLIVNDVDDEKLFLINLSSLVGKISSIIFPVSRILVEETGDISVFDHRDISKVMFLQSSDTKKIWSTIVSAADTNPLKTKLETEKDLLLYLDARYGNKVFYRFSDMTFQNTPGTAILLNHASSTSATSSVLR